MNNYLGLGKVRIREDTLPLQQYIFFHKWWPQVLLNYLLWLSAVKTKGRLCHLSYLQTPLIPCPPPVTGPIIFRTILQRSTLVFFSIHQLLLTVNLMFYKSSKDILDEIMGTKEVCPQQTVSTHSTIKNNKKGWSEEAWGQWWEAKGGWKGFVAACTHGTLPFPTTACKHSPDCSNLFIPPPNWQRKEKCCMLHCFPKAFLAQCLASS